MKSHGLIGVSSCVRVVLSFTTRTRAFSQTADLKGDRESGVGDRNLLGSVKSRAITEDYNGNSVGSYIARITTKLNVCHFEVKARLSLFHLVPLRPYVRRRGFKASSFHRGKHDLKFLAQTRELFLSDGTNRRCFVCHLRQSPLSHRDIYGNVLSVKTAAAGTLGWRRLRNRRPGKYYFISPHDETLQSCYRVKGLL